jgi:hypothetical protein
MIKRMKEERASQQCHKNQWQWPKEVSQVMGLFGSAMATESTMEKWVPRKGFPLVFRNPLRPIPNLTKCPLCPNARKPISIAISFDLLRKKVAIVQKVNVSHGKTKMDKTVRGRELPCVRHWRSLYKGRFVVCAVPMSMKKRDEEAKKMQRNGLTEKVNLCRYSGVWNPVGGGGGKPVSSASNGGV